MPTALGVGIYAACSLCGFLRTIRVERQQKIPRFLFLYVAKKVEMFHSGFGYLTEKRIVDGGYLINCKFRNPTYYKTD